MRGILHGIYAVEHIGENVSQFIVRVLRTRYVRKKVYIAEMHFG